MVGRPGEEARRCPLRRRRDERSCSATSPTPPAVRTAADLDYDDAQQLFWAFTALREDGRPPAVAEEVAKLAGPDKLLLGRLAEPGQRKLIAEVLPDRLRRVSQYRPDPFREAFDRIAAGLGAGR